MGVRNADAGTGRTPRPAPENGRRGFQATPKDKNREVLEQSSLLRPQFEPPPPLPNGQPDRSRGWSFWFFPPEIRNLIYDFSLNWPTSAELYTAYNRAIDAHYTKKKSGIEEPFPRHHAVFRTPTILLLSRDITKECLPILRSRRFVIDRLPPWLPEAMHPMPVSRFIGRRTLQNLRHIEIRCALGQGRLGSGWVWAKIVKDILDILRERNAFEDLRLVVSMFNFDNFNMWHGEMRYLQDIQKNISALQTANPKFWAPGQIEDEYWIISGFKAQRHQLNKERGWEFTALAESRQYPIDGFWPGGLLEFA